MTTPPRIDPVDWKPGMNKLLECTKGPWHGPHISGDSTCNCTCIIDEGFAGGIARVHVDNGIALITEGGNDCPPLEQAKANGLLLAAAFDHALIWWATEHSDDFDIIKEKPGDEYILLGGTGQNQATVDPSGHLSGPSLAIDPFGFPILTDDLRARLIAKMEAAK